MKADFTRLGTSLGLSLAILFGFHLVEAKEKKAPPNPPELESLATPLELEGLLMNQKAIESMAESMKSSAKKRSPAGVASDANSSKAFKDIRQRFFDAKTAADIRVLFDELATNYDTYKDNDIKFFAARVLPMREFAGFTWRMLPIIKRTRLAQEAAVGFIRGMLEQIHIRFPDAQNVAIFDYLTQPQPGSLTNYPKDGKAACPASDKTTSGKSDGYLKPFANEVAVQNYMSHQVYASIRCATSRIESLRLDPPIVMDARLRFGIDSFQVNETEELFHFIGEGERYTVLARMHRRMAALSMMVAYDLKGLVDFRKEMAQKIGFDAINIISPVTGLTREVRAQTAREGRFRKKFPNLFALRTDRQVTYSGPYAPLRSKGKIAIGNYWTIMAYEHLHRNAVYMNRAWADIRQRPTNSAYVLEPEFYSGVKDDIDTAMKTMHGMTPPTASGASPYPIHSRYETKGTGGNIGTVDLLGFLADPPKKLTDLLPTEFQQPNLQADKNGWVKDPTTGLKYRDYAQGRAIGWDKDVYRKLFPNLVNGTDVDDHQRMLVGTRGGRLVSSIFMGFIR